MKEVNYELCEKCEQAMVDAGVVGMTTEEMKEQQAEFDFGLAISFLKEGEKVARKGWNGKGMFLYLVNGQEVPYKNMRGEAKNALAKTPANETNTVFINSHIDMKAADGSVVIGWLASQTDMLSEDWIIVQ